MAVDGRAWVSGTTASSRGGEPDPDAASQTRTAFAIALESLAQLGFDKSDVVRTRMYVTESGVADLVGSVHGEIFGGVNPAATLVYVSGLIDPLLKVEVELEAVKGGNDT